MIKVYVANLGKYNEGELVGAWFTLPVSMDEVAAKVGLNDEYEEYAIHDYECDMNINEYASLDSLNELAERLEDLTDEEGKAVLALIHNGYANDNDEALDKVGDCFFHYADSMEDIAYNYYHDNGLIDEDNPLSMYIDWERVGRDMEINGTFIELEHGLWMEVCW